MRNKVRISFSLTLALIVALFGCRSNMVEGITGDKIKSIYIDMPLEELVDLIGIPYSVSYGSAIHSKDCRSVKPCNTSDIGVFREQLNNRDDIAKTFKKAVEFNLACCEANIRSHDEGGGVSFEYTKPVKNSIFYPMIWVSLSNEGLVEGVVVKEYMGNWLLGLDDLWIYHRFSHSEYIDEKRFNRHFKQ